MLWEAEAAWLGVVDRYDSLGLTTMKGVKATRKVGHLDDCICCLWRGRPCLLFGGQEAVLKTGGVSVFGPVGMCSWDELSV